MDLIPKHGGYRTLVSFQVAQRVYDLTVRFCDRYVEKRSRTHDQMVQAARSGVQNIAEGSLASATSKKTELKLTNVARASLEELLLDYEDYLRQHGLELWPPDDPRRHDLVARRLKSADEVEAWARTIPKSLKSLKSLKSIETADSETLANACHALTGVAASLLRRQVMAQARAFENEGGFTERLYRARRERL